MLSAHGILARIIYILFGEQVHAKIPNMIHNSFGFSIVVSYIWKQVPFSCLIFFARLQRVGKEYIGASRVLGASFRKSIQHVLIPLLLPTALPLSLVLFSYNYFAYEVAYIVGTSNPVVIAVQIMQAFTNAEVGIYQSSYTIMLFSFCIALCVIGSAALCYYLWRLYRYLSRRRYTQ